MRGRWGSPKKRAGPSDITTKEKDGKTIASAAAVTYHRLVMPTAIRHALLITMTATTAASTLLLLLFIDGQR